MKKIISVVLALVMILAVSAMAMENPWTESTQDEIRENYNVAFNIPEDASDVTFRVCESDGTVEMDFTWNDMKCTMRAQAQQEGAYTDEVTDISGMYYEWEVTEDATVNGCTAVIMQAHEDANTIQVCNWVDPDAHCNFSLSIVTDQDTDGFDIIGLAQDCYFPAD